VTLFFQSKNTSFEFVSDLLNALILLAFATVGAFIASRQPQNPIGWIFCIGTLFWGLGVLLLEYAVYALITKPGSLPAGPLGHQVPHSRPASLPLKKPEYARRSQGMACKHFLFSEVTYFLHKGHDPF
jgi:hypothetical protein